MTQIVRTNCDLLEEVKEILNNLESDLEKQRFIWNQIERDNPGFESVSEKSWEKNRARHWLHGSADSSEANELERWLFDSPPPSDMSKANARECVRYWREWLKIENAYYEPFSDFEFEDPKKGETLAEFLNRMANKVESEGKGARLEWRALKSFLGYVRKFTQESAFIEQIFPKKMDLYHGKIIRNTALEEHPIPEEIAAEILMELAKKCRYGREDARITAAESLGLCWLSLTASKLRLPVYLEQIRAIESISIHLDGEFPILGIPTLFGTREIRISHHVAKFLHLLSLIPSTQQRKTILQRDRRSLERSFDGALKNIAPDPKYINITYRTLLSFPHHFGHHRYQPK